MKKLLIAVDSQTISDDLYDKLNSNYEIYCCYDGASALSIIHDIRPDMLVLDLMLADLDGITVLQSMKAAGISPRVIVLSAMFGSYVSAALEQLDVCYAFRYSSDMRTVAARIMEIGENSVEHPSVQTDICNLLALLGFNMNASGTRITELAVTEYMENPGQTLSRYLYPKLANLCNGTPKQVEKAIRSSIGSAWHSRNEAVWRLYFAIGKNGKVAKPTNADFLARISICVENITRTSELSEKKKIS